MIKREMDKLLKRIANHLMINSDFMHNLGLYHGKMGIAIFFEHYARYTHDKLYDDYAGELIDEVYEGLQKNNLTLDFENGLCGIGWGFDYLLRNKYMEGDVDDVLEEIDKRIMEIDMQRVIDKSFLRGASGIGFYINTRIKASNKGKRTSFDRKYIMIWEKIESKYSLPDNNDFLQKIPQIEMPQNNNIIALPLGLQNGCAGIGLKSIIRL